MLLQIYWRSNRTRRCTAVVAMAAALVAPLTSIAAPDPKPADRVTAREAIERQFAATPSEPREMSGAESARILEKYHGRIGKMIEPKREIGESRADR